MQITGSGFSNAGPLTVRFGATVTTFTIDVVVSGSTMFIANLGNGTVVSAPISGGSPALYSPTMWGDGVAAFAVVVVFVVRLPRELYPAAAEFRLPPASVSTSNRTESPSESILFDFGINGSTRAHNSSGTRLSRTHRSRIEHHAAHRIPTHGESRQRETRS
ncbi:hypothetical protein ACIRRA_23115 [Nocardia sp. NPDC101769]|uniref:hypothetical protein n=1 Tax=Nocardia sp. NPDC101769 TaxID=3364333 RepID=UPI0037FAEEF2